MTAPTTDHTPIRLCLFGAAPDTTNLGVSALFESTLTGLARRLANMEMTVFDNGWGTGDARLGRGAGEISYRRCGSRNSWRLHRSDSSQNQRWAARFGGLGNPGSRAVLNADVVLDLSGGDSFADIYGPKRYRAITVPKRMALENRVPLVLLPQTYGPFQGKAIRRDAVRILRGATSAWSRDPRSYETLQELLGPDFDSERHRSGCDVAFALPATKPALPVTGPIASWLSERDHPIVGFNVSGLIYGDPEGARTRFGFRADYVSLVHETLERILRDSDARVLLIPHVLLDPVHAPRDSDEAACRQVEARLASRFSDRVHVLEAFCGASEMKWFLAQLDWFCGTRMHSTIGALSSGVATVALAYSDKTLGVFETCGQGHCVVDPRTLDTDEAVQQILDGWRNARETRDDLAKALPGVLQQAEQQMDELADLCRKLASANRRTSN